MKILYRILSGIFYVLGAVTVSFILYLNMTKSALMPLTYAGQVHFQTNTLLFYIVFAASCVLLVGGAYLAYRDRTGFIAQNGLLLFFLIGTVLYLIAGLFLIFKVPVSLRAEAEIMSSIALLVKIIPNVRFIFLMNLVLILFNNLLILNITDALFHHDMRIDFIAILLSFLMLPHLFLCIYSYGIIPGLTALLLSFLAFIRFEQRGYVRDAVIGIAGAVLAVTLRGNYVIGVIAELILLILIFIRSCASDNNNNNRVRYLITALILIPILFVPGFIPKAEIEQSTAYSSESTAFQSIDVAAGNPDEIENGRNDAYTVLMRKLASTWTEPTFESVWAGPLEADAQKISVHFLRDIYTGGNSYDILNLICGITSRLLLAGCVIFLIRSLIQWIKDLSESGYSGSPFTFALFPLLFLIGGFLFYYFRESRSLYVFCYAYMLLPLAAAGLSFGEE